MAYMCLLHGLVNGHWACCMRLYAVYVLGASMGVAAALLVAVAVAGAVAVAVQRQRSVPLKPFSYVLTYKRIFVLSCCVSVWVVGVSMCVRVFVSVWLVVVAGRAAGCPDKMLKTGCLLPFAGAGTCLF